MDVAPGTWRYATPVLVVGGLALAFSPAVSAAALVTAIGVVVFHRDPEREVADGGILAPADGKISVIRTDGDRLRVGIFMNLTDVHVNRAPMAGTVRAVSHSPGAHRPAFSKDSDRNEKVHVDCGEFTVVQIAGAFARRIHPYVEPGDELDRGDRLGHISFGSRVDVLMPDAIDREDLAVSKGDPVTAGETRLVKKARVRNAPAPRRPD
jgi:phosphatidylserine decarboxylase